MNEITIFPPNLDLKSAHKWMWHPDGFILISSNYNPHIISYHFFKKDNPDIPSFYDWIRFIHLKNPDFVPKYYKEDLLCVRGFDNKTVSKENIFELVSFVDINSKIVFDITNDKLKELTGNYNAHY